MNDVVENEELQVENGNYTRVVNRVLEELVKAPLLGAELAICIFVIRKTYGFNKKEDEISLSQFEIGVERSRPTIVKALKNLQLVNILKLVKKGDSKKQSNVWVFNKYYSTWKLVKLPQLVKNRTSTSKEKLKQLVKTPKHTKDNIQKTITKDTTTQSVKDDINKFIYLFKDINPSLDRIYGRDSQRGATERLLKQHDLEWWERFMEAYKVKITDRFCPKALTPLQMEEKIGAITLYAESLKSKKPKIFI